MAVKKGLPRAGNDKTQVPPPAKRTGNCKGK